VYETASFIVIPLSFYSLPQLFYSISYKQNAFLSSSRHPLGRYCFCIRRHSFPSPGRLPWYGPFFLHFFHENNNILACAIPCTTSADLGTCQVTDYHCLCTSQTFVASVTKCLTSACSGDDLQKALTLSQQLCAKVVCDLLMLQP